MIVIGILPIKAHSERVPDKNFRWLYDKPLWKWPMETMLACPWIKRVIVNTDCPERLSVKDDRVLVERRAQSLCGDYISMNDILVDIATRHETDVYLQMHATNPFVRATTITGAKVQLDDRGEVDGLFGASVVSARLYSKTLRPINHDLDNLIRTQDLERIYMENSAFYLVRRVSLLLAKRRIHGSSYPYITSAMEAVDIDTEEQWEMAKRLARP